MIKDKAKCSPVYNLSVYGTFEPIFDSRNSRLTVPLIHLEKIHFQQAVC